MKRGENLFKHGLTRSPEHRSWLSMMTRCVWSNPDRDDWHLYKGRGISVCDRWLEFKNFLSDMGHKPTPQHSLDRIDSDGNYEPSNCRWATSKDQARNWKHRNRKYTVNGETKVQAEWLESIGITGATFRDRVKNGWPLSKALTTPGIRNRERRTNGRFASARI